MTAIGKFSPLPHRETKVAGVVNLATQIIQTRQLINDAAASGNTQHEARLRERLEELQIQQNNGTSSSFKGA
jgi:hypothetical protein